MYHLLRCGSCAIWSLPALLYLFITVDTSCLKGTGRIPSLVRGRHGITLSDTTFSRTSCCCQYVVAKVCCSAAADSAQNKQTWIRNQAWSLQELSWQFFSRKQHSWGDAKENKASGGSPSAVRSATDYAIPSAGSKWPLQAGRDHFGRSINSWNTDSWGKSLHLV